MVIVAVGSCNKAITIKNPWTAAERVQMIQQAIKDENGKPWNDTKMETDLHRIKFIEVRDYLYNDVKWSSEVFSKAVQAGATEDRDTALYGCFKDDNSSFLNAYPQWNLRETTYLYNLNATDIRQDMFDKQTVEHWDKMLPNLIINEVHKFTRTERFKTLKAEHDHYKAYKESFSGIPFPPTFVTVDSLAIKSGNILIIERGINPGKSLYALPGGFVNQNERLEDAAIRELKEETNIRVDVEDLKKSIKEVKVFDHPKRSLRGRVITHCHLIDLGPTGKLPSVKAGDDANKAFWMPLADVLSSERMFFDDHFDMCISLTSRF
jgi:bifunctional NMN adenylyltransferase/nudix hydrolase